MKVVMADTMLAGAADMVFGAQQQLLALDAWLGVLAFSGQIFFDFAGYSTCAIGLAAMLGFNLPDNFRYPYAAVGFSDFWRRWHITLSTWLRDYVYIPLGGNRNGQAKTYVNLMLTMLLGGLWHGASWTFVVWGALHGLFLGVERFLKSRITRKQASVETMIPETDQRQVIARASMVPALFNSTSINKFMLALLTFFLVNVTWVFFRANDFGTAWRLLSSMFGVADNGVPVLPTLDIIRVAVISVLLIATHWVMRNTTVWQQAQKMKWWMVSIIWSLMIILLILSQKSSDSFIYFQF